MDDANEGVDRGMDPGALPVGQQRRTFIPRLVVTGRFAPGTGTLNQEQNWSGIEADGSNTYISVSGTYTMPTWLNTPCASTAETSWVGLGGVNSKKLIQAGTFTPLGYPTSSQYLFYEYLKPVNQGISATAFSPTISPAAGDAITSTVTYRASDGNVTFYVADATQGKSGVLNMVLGSSYYDGSSAEWIDERPEYTGMGFTNDLSNLKTFSSVNWTNATAEQSSGTVTAAGNLPHDSFEMTASTKTSQVLASVPSLTTSLSWSDDYTYCYGQ